MYNEWTVVDPVRLAWNDREDLERIIIKKKVDKLEKRGRKTCALTDQEQQEGKSGQRARFYTEVKVCSDRPAAGHQTQPTGVCVVLAIRKPEERLSRLQTRLQVAHTNRTFSPRASSLVGFLSSETKVSLIFTSIVSQPNLT